MGVYVIGVVKELNGNVINMEEENNYFFFNKKRMIWFLVFFIFIKWEECGNI